MFADPTLRADLTVLLDDYATAGRRCAYEVRVLTDMYHAVWHVACEQQREIERQRIQIAEMRDERDRYAREAFGRTPADE